MMCYRSLVRWVVTLSFCLGAGGALAASPPEGVTAEVTPAVIPMGTFFSGATVHVEGKVPLGSEVIVAVRGPEVTEVFNKVGRAGPIWVNTGKVSVSGIPSLLLVFSTKPVHNCLCRGELDRCQLDATAIKNQIKISPPTQETDIIAGEFLKLKYRQRSYQLENTGIRVESPQERGRRFTLDFHWPKNAAAGTYLIRVSACRGGDVTESLEIPLKVVEVGFPAMIAGLAKDRPATYGIISVVVAVLAGFGIDFLTTQIFKRKVSAH
jgi:uncharacterized protein (TIGR02186 family)